MSSEQQRLGFLEDAEEREGGRELERERGRERNEREEEEVEKWEWLLPNVTSQISGNRNIAFGFAPGKKSRLEREIMS